MGIKIFMNQSIKKALIRATYDKRKLHREILKLHKCAKEMECSLNKLFPCKSDTNDCNCKQKNNSCSKGVCHRRTRKK